MDRSEHYRLFQIQGLPPPGSPLPQRHQPQHLVDEDDLEIEFDEEAVNNPPVNNPPANPGQFNFDPDPGYLNNTSMWGHW